MEKKKKGGAGAEEAPPASDGPDLMGPVLAAIRTAEASPVAELAAPLPAGEAAGRAALVALSEVRYDMWHAGNNCHCAKTMLRRTLT